MTRLKHLAALLFGGVLLSGCANGGGFAPGGMFGPQTTCAALDWGGVGFEDGSNGRSIAEFDRRVAGCQPGGPAPDRVTYLAGRDAGLRSYCTGERGYSEGYSGRRYDGVCPVQLAAAYQTGYAKGIEDRRAYASRPRISLGVGIGSGGYSRVGVGVGVGTIFGY